MTQNEVRNIRILLSVDQEVLEDILYHSLSRMIRVHDTKFLTRSHRLPMTDMIMSYNSESLRGHEFSEFLITIDIFLHSVTDL